ncbi:Periplasmic nitrate reductase [Emticicia aquatica]|uniref:Periplasmic nitrate reductase n=1 Tax=Emticicia aquatica TaxID=1681835 RepID=A0ABN8ESX7_9BACT|nr:nitrate reductase [Emticicia aquatica]CAH0994743.1 Periplasmic nitrate reductase [Emticicia aquatica]
MKEAKKYKTTCCYCGVGCGIVATDLGNGKIHVEGDKEHPVNKGMLCSKGMNLHYTVNDKSDRLLYPQMRMNRSMPMQRSTWDETLDRTAAIFKTFINKYGPDSVGFYVSGQCLTEEYYLWNKLMKGFIGSNNIDTNSRLCMSSAVVGYKLSLGEDSVPVCYDDIEESDCILVEGANPAWCHPIIWRRVEAHKAASPNVKIITVDPRRTQTASASDVHLQINPGSDVTLNHAIGRILIENDWLDNDFLKNHTDGFEEYRTKVFEKTLTESAEICGVDEKSILKTAKLIANAKGFLSMWTMGLNQSVIGVNKNLSLINLSLITGKIGKAGNGPFSLTGQPNAMGGREVGGLANMLASHREIANPQHRTEMEEFWGGNKISDKIGLTATEMFKSLEEGKLKAIWIVCTNPMVSLPDSRMAELAMKNAKFVVVQDISNRADTIKFADVVLPAAAWAEKEGTMTNAERRISYLNKIVDAPGEALPDAEIICRFAKKMGWGAKFTYENFSEIYHEFTQTTKGTNIDITGVSYELLKEKTIQWPYTNAEEKVKSSIGTKRLFQNGEFYTPNKRAKIHAVPDENLSEKLSQDFPLILLTGRIRDQWHTMTKTARVNKLNQHLPIPYVEIHPNDAKKRNILEEEIVEIKGKRGDVKVKAKITDEVKQGTCFLPMHWGRVLGNDFGRANNLTSNLVDARSKEPDFKFSAVEVTKYVKSKEKIIVIGAGSAGLGFISAYRKLNQTDDIEVFSKEIYPFYNRVMLPDYISGTQSWEQLVKLREDQFIENNIRVHKAICINHIDRKNKVVVDDLGNEHRYDKLFLGMGSQAFMPKNFPKMAGIFNMRSRLDADTLQPFLKKNRNVVIVGGGLLGLEMAASLREININVTVVQRIGRFMDRQLDPLGSDILHEEIVARGIEVYFNDEVEQFYGTEKITGVRLKSGQKLDCDAIIVAAGTVPTIQLARDAGLACNRGVEVNNYLQTSDPDIFACGEIAEWKKQMWGITAAAEQQAEIVAKFLAGDLSTPYKGSLSMNLLKMHGLNLCSLGIIEIPAGSADYEEVTFIDKAKHYYKKCIIYNDRLVGAILIGDKSEFLEFRDLIANGIELSEKRLALLRSGKISEPVLGKLVCSCNNVGKGNLEKAIKEGCTDFAQICLKTGAGTGCGSCRPEVRMILENIGKDTLVAV